MSLWTLSERPSVGSLVGNDETRFCTERARRRWSWMRQVLAQRQRRRYHQPIFQPDANARWRSRGPGSDTDTSIPGVCHICGVQAGIHTCTDGVQRLPLPLATQDALDADRVRMGGLVAPWNDIFPDHAACRSLHRAFPANWGEQHCVTCYKPWPCPDASAQTKAPFGCGTHSSIHLSTTRSRCDAAQERPSAGPVRERRARRGDPDENPSRPGCRPAFQHRAP